MAITLRLTTIVLTGTIFTVGLAGQGRTITRANLPPAVQKTVDEQSQGAVIKGFVTEVENGKRIYEVELTVNGHGKDIAMDAQGHVLEVEEEVVLDALPAAVKGGLTKSAGAGKITKVESLTKGGTLVAYEAVVQTGTKHKEIQVGPNGQKLAHPE
jgi:hypothetical protein